LEFEAEPPLIQSDLCYHARMKKPKTKRSTDGRIVYLRIKNSSVALSN
jgi:hypothetical protein